MKQNPLLFSIIIPTYNRADSLGRCLESLAQQKFKNFEVLICDDGSTDNTRDIVDLFEQKLNQKYILNKNSGGPAGPRNIGVANARGEWLCFLDSDDWYAEDKLEYVSKMNLETVDFIYHNLFIVQNDVVINQIKSRHLSNTDAYHDLLFNMNAIPTSSVCVRKSIFDKTSGFLEKKEIIGLEDFQLWLNLAKNGTRFKYIDKPLGFYFVGNDKLTVTDERQINRYKYFYQEFIDLEVNQANKNKIEAALQYHIGWVYYKNKDYKKAVSFLLQSLFAGSTTIKLRSLYFFIRAFLRF